VAGFVTSSTTVFERKEVDLAGVGVEPRLQVLAVL
jgi:hypothetical protein